MNISNAVKGSLATDKARIGEENETLFFKIPFLLMS